jgi:hypothetical protein
MHESASPTALPSQWLRPPLPLKATVLGRSGTTSVSWIRSARRSESILGCSNSYMTCADRNAMTYEQLGETTVAEAEAIIARARGIRDAVAMWLHARHGDLTP